MSDRKVVYKKTHIIVRRFSHKLKKKKSIIVKRNIFRSDSKIVEVTIE